LKCLAYIRVSTKEQDEEIQLKAIREFAEKRGFNIIEWYIDKGQSGSKPFRDRPAARKLLEDLEKHIPNAIISWSLDRLGRTMLDTVQTVIELENKGIKVITVKEEWLQTLDPNIRRLILSILAWVSEFERRRIRERQEEAWRQGKQKGRPPKIRHEEIEVYLRKYPRLSLRAITDLINADRERRGLPKVSYYTVYKKAKQMGYTKQYVRT